MSLLMALPSIDNNSFLQPLQSLIDSKEKENSLSKFVRWECRWWHPQEQYEKIGDLSRRCVFAIQSLSTYLTLKHSTENLHFSTDIRETCKEICCETAMALTQLSHAMKHKTAPAASIYIHVKAALDLASDQENTLKLKFTLPLENTLQAKAITSDHLVESVMIIKKLLEPVIIIEELASSIKELTVLPLVPINPQEVATGTIQLVAPMKKLVSQLFALQKKFKINCSSVSDGPDTTQHPVNLVTISNSEPRKEEVAAHASIDMINLLAHTTN